MDHGQLSIGGEVDLDLDRVCSLLDRELEGGQRVLGAVGGGSAVADDQRHPGSSRGGTTAGSSVASSARRSSPERVRPSGTPRTMR